MSKDLEVWLKFRMKEIDRRLTDLKARMLKGTESK
jgi:hypothetical protein